MRGFSLIVAILSFVLVSDGANAFSVGSANPVAVEHPSCPKDFGLCSDAENTRPTCGPGVQCIYKCYGSTNPNRDPETCRCQITGPGEGPGQREYGYECITPSLNVEQLGDMVGLY